MGGQALRKAFPNLQRVSSYAAPKDILRKSPEEMKQLFDAGLKLLYYGMESGDSETLLAIRKGVDGPQSIEAGKRVIAAGMKLSIMVILGIAGKEGSERHALATAKAISEIQPTMLSALCLMLYRGSELKDQFERGEFHPLSPGGLMHELQLMLENIHLPEGCHTLFRSNHVSNYVNFAGTLPKDQERLIREVAMAAGELDKLKSWDVYNYG